MSEPTEELKGNEPKREKVRIIPVELIDDFPDHPFQVKSVAQIAEEYGFTAQQTEMLTELLSSENAELWAGILSE